MKKVTTLIVTSNTVTSATSSSASGSAAVVTTGEAPLVTAPHGVEKRASLNATHVASLMEPCDFVPESMTVMNALKLMRKQRVHMMVVVDEFGGVDILVHNAASRGNISIEELDFATYFKPIDISINGFFHLAKACLPSMRERGGGAIVGVGGMTSTRGAPGRAHVSAAKMGQAAFVRGLAHDLAQYGIRANNVVVGVFDTDRSGPSSAPTSPSAHLKIPLGRKGLPEDLATLVRFVVGPDASYITGESIHCNGGAHMNL